MSSKNEDDDFVKFVHSFNAQLRLESERGSVIVGAAFIEEGLEEMLKASMLSSVSKNNDELFNGPYAPLSSLSAKIDLAYRMNLISFDVRASLHHIRKLRNDFAHISSQINFATQSVHSRIQELFNLNKDLINTIWQIAKDNLEDSIKDYYHENGVDNLVQNIGWKSTYEIIISIIAATLRTNKEATRIV